jgi:hypothetical protein
MGGVGSGRRPKTYPAEMIEKVSSLYGAGKTQAEIAGIIGASQKVIWNIMRRAAIPRRVAAKRDQRGAKNHAWKGGAAKYAALHLRVQSARGVPSKCEDCGVEGASARFEWANLTGRYDDVDDYRRLCCSCHHKMDGTVRNLGRYAERKEVSR